MNPVFETVFIPGQVIDFITPLTYFLRLAAAVG
jgi:hypothetical protein